MITIDKKRCTGCGICLETCPSFVLTMADKKVCLARPESCLDCNQCVSVCPARALSNDLFSKKDYPSIKTALSASAFDRFAAARRSIRSFKPNAVPRELLCQMIESAAMAAPTGKNAQELRYLIIDDKKQLLAISAFMLKKAEGILRLISILRPLAYLLMGRGKTEKILSYLDRLGEIESESENGKLKKDPFLRNAPALIIIYSSKSKALNYLDAGIAGYHLNLAALTHKLGTCWIGYHSIMCERSSKLKILSGMDKKDRVLATIAVGYPAFKYQSGCARKKPEIRYNLK